MFLFKLNFVMHFVIVFLPHKGFSPNNNFKLAYNNSLFLPDGPMNASQIFDERENCKRQIHTYFKETDEPKAHAKHAIKVLRIADPLNNYGRLYYKQIYNHLAPGTISDIETFCSSDLVKRCFLENCKYEIRSAFKARKPNFIVQEALHETNYDICSKLEFSKLYFESIMENFELVMESVDKSEPFLKPEEFCNNLIGKPITKNLDLNSHP